MIRDFFAHVRFFAKAKKISHGLIKSAGGNNGKAPFTLLFSFQLQKGPAHMTRPNPHKKTDFS